MSPHCPACCRILAASLLLAVSGCSLTSQNSSVIAPKSTVLAHATGPRKPWLESADLTYWKPHTRTGGVQPVSHSEQAAASGFSVLGVRYPHPEGKRGKARVEIVVVGAQEPSGESSWLGSIRRTVDETLPGMSWGDGIQQAKSLDISVSELETMLQDTRQIMLTAATVQSPPTANLVAEVNDRRTTHRLVPLATFERLKQRVAQEGRLISYSGTAEELRQRLAPAPVVVAGGAASQPGLVPLPPVR